MEKERNNLLLWNNLATQPYAQSVRKHVQLLPNCHLTTIELQYWNFCNTFSDSITEKELRKRACDGHGKKIGLECFTLGKNHFFS